MKTSYRGNGDDLEELRQLLLGDDLQKLEDVHTRVEIPENFSSQVGEVLPQALVKSSEQGEALSEAMLPTVEEIVRLSIKKDINRFADALFPVIGPAIRKAIGETLRQMLQSLNRTLEQSLSWQGVKWRMQSMRTGIPFAQIALLHGLVYQVEQVFLIHRGTGLMLCHLQRENCPVQNPDLVSSMLSAINDFVADSFAVEANNRLGNVEVGELSIWIEAGPRATLAIAIRGEAPATLRTRLQQRLEQIEYELSDSLERFDGDTRIFEQRSDLLTDCLQAQFRDGEERIAAKTWIIVAALIGLLLYWSAGSWLDAKRLNRTLERFSAEPGYLVTGADDRGGVLVISGMRDPLATSPNDVLTDSPMHERAVEFAFEPYQSLQPDFVERRAVKILAPPPDVRISLAGDELKVAGAASLAWRDQLRARAPLIAGINALDDSALRVRFEASMLSAPDSVEIELEDGILYLEGAAEHEWISWVQTVSGQYPEVDEVDIRALVNLTEVELIEDIDQLERKAVFFGVSESYDFDSIDTSRLSALVKSIIEKAELLSLTPRIVVRGYSDSIGSFDDNRLLSLERAGFVSQALFDAGISPHYVATRGLEAPVETEKSEAERRYNRRVGFEVILE